jgi:hypothetical protein
MPINNNPIFIGAPRVQSAISNAASGRDGTTGNLFLLCTPGPNGSRIERITAITTGTMSSPTSAMAIRIYIQNVDDLTNYLYREAVFPIVTPGTAIVGPNTTFNFNGGLCLGTQSKIYVGQSTFADADDRISWTAELGDF